jgi:hypothetical protein
MRARYGYLFLLVVVVLFECGVNIYILLRHGHPIAMEESGDRQSLDEFLATEESRPIIPLRSREEKEFAQLCTRARRGAVYVKHNRKAGGSSIYQVLQPAVCPRTPVFSSELPFFNATRSFSALPNSTVWLTTLRHPVDRILSLYWFEGRWPRTCDMACELKRKKDDSNKVAELGEWVESVYHQTNILKFKLRPHHGCGLWQSVENYYIRQLIGVDRGMNGKFLNRTLTKDDLHRAKEVLASFDLVMIQERFSGSNHDPEMVQMFRAITGASNQTVPGSNMPHSRQGMEKKTNYKRPSAEELARLKELNKLDIELFEFAEKLSRKTVANWKQQQRSKGSRLDSTMIQQCEVPPRNLTMDKARILLGGEGCRETYFFYYSPSKKHPKCLLHSASRPQRWPRRHVQ